jgi:hypothetical protein
MAESPTPSKKVKENTRLGIPVLFHEECLHGHAGSKGTSFPQAIALASTWDPELVQEVFSATSREVRARGAQQCLTPVLDLAREPRWGMEETWRILTGSRLLPQPGPGIGPFTTNHGIAIEASRGSRNRRSTNTAPGTIRARHP